LHRNLIFLVVVAVLVVLIGYHQANGATWELAVDFGILAFALQAWKPWRRR
jgi:hypothetical protein